MSLNEAPKIIPNEPVQEAFQDLLKKIEEQNGFQIVQSMLLVTVVNAEGICDTLTLARMMPPAPMKTSLPDLQMLSYLIEIITVREKERFGERLKNGEEKTPSM